MFLSWYFMQNSTNRTENIKYVFFKLRGFRGHYIISIFFVVHYGIFFFQGAIMPVHWKDFAIEMADY